MIELSPQLCETLDLVYWKLKANETNAQPQTKTIYSLPDEQKQLLTNILIAINIQLESTMIELIEETKVIVKVNDIELIFSDVLATDTANAINLAGLKQMQDDPTYKKQTWLKLKKFFL
jgi:hypothetical protein